MSVMAGVAEEDDEGKDKDRKRRKELLENILCTVRNNIDLQVNGEEFDKLFKKKKGKLKRLGSMPDLRKLVKEQDDRRTKSLDWDRNEEERKVEKWCLDL